MKNILVKAVIAGSVVGYSMIGSAAIAAPVQQASPTTSTATAPSMTYYELNDSQLGLGSSDYTFDVSAKGVATATSKVSGQAEVLPEQTTDARGVAVSLKYEETAAGELIISVVDPVPQLARTSATASTADFNPAQCALGTVGGAGAGAVAGGLGGAAVGTVTLPIVGTVGAGAVGLIGGGVFGGMTGAAASCFG